MITWFKKLLHLVAPVVITLWDDDTLLEAMAFVSVTSGQFLQQDMDLNQWKTSQREKSPQICVPK